MATQEAAGATAQEGSIEAMMESLADLVGTALTIHLYKSGMAPSYASKEADFEASEADFTGYLPVALTMSAVGLDSAGQPFSTSGASSFQCTLDSDPSNVIGGCWIEVQTAAGPPAVKKVLRWFSFDQTVDLHLNLDAMSVEYVQQAENPPGFVSVVY